MRLYTCFFALICFAFPLFSQTEESDLRFFGYFQNSFTYETAYSGSQSYTSFNMQQLNLIAQKDISSGWRTFINFKLINNFSSEKQWGAFSIEEAWLRYYLSNEFNLKLGLQIPVFNSFNEVKDRSPLIPYVVKPLVYEDSFSEIINIEHFVPKWAFIQAYGFLGHGEFKWDYAFYLGNSSNVLRWGDPGISGSDTTDTFLAGGRTGIRYKDLKIGISMTSDQFVADSNLQSDHYIPDPAIKGRIHRMRFGADFSYEINNIDLKFEYIKVYYDVPRINIDKEFYYGTLGYYIDDKWYVYISHWFDGEKFLPYADAAFIVDTAGFSYRYNDRISFKVQYAQVLFDTKIYIEKFPFSDEDFKHLSVAVSVFF